MEIKSIYYADFSENYDSEDFTCAGFTFASDTFEYTFGRIMDDGPTNQEQYVGYGQNMVKFDPPAPKKRDHNVEWEINRALQLSRSCKDMDL